MRPKYVFIALTLFVFLSIYVRHCDERPVPRAFCSPPLGESSPRNSTFIQRNCLNLVVQYNKVASYTSSMSNRWTWVPRVTTIPNWSIDTEFPIFPRYLAPNIKFIGNHFEGCKRDAEVDVVVAVISACGNAKQRDMLRNEMPLPEQWTRVFVLGRPVVSYDRSKAANCQNNWNPCYADSKMERKLLEEDKEYKDLIMGDFWDTYRNLTLKSIGNKSVYACVA